MEVLVIGAFPEATKQKITDIFPKEWTLHIAPPQEAARFLPRAEVVIPEHVQVDAAFLARAPKLRLVHTGAGHDNVDLKACAARGVRVCGAAGVNASAVAEHTMALLLAWYKNIPRLDGFMKARGSELSYSGGELAGKTIGLVGLGHIGARVAALCRAFDMQVLGCSRRAAPPDIEAVGLEELLRRSDVVSLHIPLTDATRGMIGRAELAGMKKTALLINTSRGAVVDEAALVQALTLGQIAGACLDVYAQEPLPQGSPLRSMENVILTPHTAGFPDGVGYHEARYRFFIRNIRRLLASQQLEQELGRV